MASWALKGEGNANIVLGYVGQDPRLEGLMLRVRKAHASPKRKKGCLHGLADDVIWQDVLKATDALERELEYIRDWLGPHLGLEYVHPGVTVAVPPEVHTLLAAQGQQAALDLPAVLVPNHAVFGTGAPRGWSAVGPVVSVEIKPKSGVLACGTHISADSAIKREQPRFLMHVLLKHLEGKGQLSSYNPMHLFSGQYGKVAAALHALLQAPNNNLRVFMDGQLVFGGRPGAEKSTSVYSGSTNDLNNLATHWQLCLGGNKDAAAAANGHAPEQAGAANGHAPVMGGDLKMLVQVVQEALISQGVLDKLLKVQQMDVVDVEGVLPMYHKLLELLQVGSQESGAEQKPAGDGKGSSELPTIPSITAAIRNYLTGATAKDCGLMVTLQRVTRAEQGKGVCDEQEASATAASAAAAVAGPVAAAVHARAGEWASAAEALTTARQPPQLLQVTRGHCSGTTFMFKIALLDLDIKPSSKIPAHYDLDQRVVACALQHQDLLTQLREQSDADAAAAAADHVPCVHLLQEAGQS